MNGDDLTTKVAPGDIIAFKGRGLVSRVILAAQGTSDSATHVALVLTCKPPLIIEAAHPRVRVRLLSSAVDEAEKAWIIHHQTLSDDQRERIVARASSFDALPYGHAALALHALNAAFSTTWFTRNWLPRMNRDLDPDIRAGLDQIASPNADRNSVPWWFRLVVFLLIPLLVPFFMVDFLRAFLEGLMKPSFFALAEGAFLFALGVHYLTSTLVLADASRWLVCSIVYFWLLWVVFLELRALTK